MEVMEREGNLVTNQRLKGFVFVSFPYSMEMVVSGEERGFLYRGKQNFDIECRTSIPSSKNYL